MLSSPKFSDPSQIHTELPHATSGAGVRVRRFEAYEYSSDTDDEVCAVTRAPLIAVQAGFTLSTNGSSVVTRTSLYRSQAVQSIE
jgi:hypothetical protein